MNNEVNNTQLIERLISGEMGQRIASEMLQEQHEGRLALQDAITPLREKRKAERAIYEKEMAKTLPRLEAAKAEHKAAEEAHNKVVYAEQQSKLSFSANSKHLQARIAATAPKIIDEFIELLAKLQTETQQLSLKTKAVPTGRYYPATGKDEKAHYSLIPSINHRLAGIHSARDHAMLLKKEVLAVDELQNRLNALRDSIPEITTEHVYNKAAD